MRVSNINNNQFQINLKIFILAIISISFIYSENSSARTIHKERSIYRNIVIVENNNKRCMRFETRRRSISNQACMLIDNPDKLVFEYTQSLMAAFSFNAQPERILIIGLGGGSLPMALTKILPNAEIMSVEIDPAVAQLARKYFNYQENEKIKTTIRDGRVFIKRAIKQQQQYDWIILDAFNGDYIPEHLLTVEFLEEAKSLLSKGGILSANTFSGSKLYDYESVTYQKVFGQLQSLKSATKGNRIIFGCNCDELSKNEKIDDSIIKSLKTVGVDLLPLIERVTQNIDWDTQVRPLTDQFSPANLLNQ